MVEVLVMWANYRWFVPRYKLTIAYDGTEFCGWQKQFPHADAVQPIDGGVLAVMGGWMSARKR